MGPIQTLEEIRRWLIRRSGLIVLVAVVVSTLGIMFAMNSDRVYRASAVI